MKCVVIFSRFYYVPTLLFLSFIKLALLVGIVDVFISPPKKFKICKLLDENQIFTGRFYCSIAVVSYTHFRNTYAEGNNGSVDRQIVKTKFRKVKKAVVGQPSN